MGGATGKKTPKHIAILVDGCEEYSAQHQKEMNEVYEKEFSNIKKTIQTAAELDIPILTFHSRKKINETEIDHMIKFFENLLDWELIKKNQIKISVLGKWYDLPERLLEPIKKIITETKEYDKFFVNFCINYSGKEEIVDACKLIAQQVKLDKITADKIDASLIKENIYSSYFLPPNLLIITGTKKTTGGMLLWDSSETIIHFSGKLWPEFGKEDFLRAIETH
ncbi:di-trans,poly-cis-decaprenylcistransferase [Candidatus Woesearchaeota archaeon]|nr:di-trans,poly-cis-decaprenylcistransferase [Candidatus Woesearchaeota archaeon]